EERRHARVRGGRPADPLKVTVTRSGGLGPAARFFTAGEGSKLVYCAEAAAAGLRSALGGLAEVVGLPGREVDPRALLSDLGRRGVRRLLVEGGGEVLTRFLTAGLADELQVSVAPFFVGESAAPRFVRPGNFPHDRHARMQLKGVERLGDVALLTYLLHKK